MVTWYHTFPLFSCYSQGQIIPIQIFLINSHIIPQYSQNFSQVFKPQAERRVLLMCIPNSLSQEAKKVHFTQSFTPKLWNNLPIRWNDLTMEWSDLKPWCPTVATENLTNTQWGLGVRGGGGGVGPLDIKYIFLQWFHIYHLLIRLLISILLPNRRSLKGSFI